MILQAVVLNCTSRFNLKTIKNYFSNSRKKNVYCEFKDQEKRNLDQSWNKMKK